MFQTVEGNEIKEEISEDLLEGLNELDQVKNEESEAITSQGLDWRLNIMCLPPNNRFSFSQVGEGLFLILAF